jgi:hypothetical protein
MLEKIEGTIVNVQSRNSGNTGHTRQDEDTKKTQTNKQTNKQKQNKKQTNKQTNNRTEDHQKQGVSSGVHESFKGK